MARRENLWEYAVERVMNPFAGRLQDGEQEHKPGRKVTAWIDADDPGAICPGR